MADEPLRHLAGGRARVAVVVADADRRSRVTEALSSPEFEVVPVPGLDGPTITIRETDADLLVIDLRGDGEVGGVVRDVLDIGTPPVVLIVDSDVTGVAGLEAGAADYLVEPVLDRELRARALLRASHKLRPIVDCGDFLVDRAARSVYVDGVEVDLAPREFDLLEFLVRRPGQVFTREQLLDRVWGSSSRWQDHDTVTEHIYRIRRKIETDPERPRRIRTIRGAGYRFDR